MRLVWQLVVILVDRLGAGGWHALGFEIWDLAKVTTLCIVFSPFWVKWWYLGVIVKLHSQFQENFTFLTKEIAEEWFGSCSSTDRWATSRRGWMLSDAGVAKPAPGLSSKEFIIKSSFPPAHLLQSLLRSYAAHTTTSSDIHRADIASIVISKNQHVDEHIPSHWRHVSPNCNHPSHLTA